MSSRSIATRRPEKRSAWRASIGAVLALGVLLPLTACQAAPAAPARADAPAAREVPVPADRIDGRLAQQQALSERFAGRPADRIEEQLQRQASGRCIQHVLIEDSDGRWRLECIATR